jgi:hypothetical protein
MRRFPDLTPEEKAKALDIILERNIKKMSSYNSDRYKSLSDSFKDRIEKDLKNKSIGHLCGCGACLIFMKDFIKRNDDIKEYILALSRQEVETIYVPSDDDLIIEV